MFKMRGPSKFIELCREIPVNKLFLEGELTGTFVYAFINVVSDFVKPSIFGVFP
jgi:hypothetical protein